MVQNLKIKKAEPATIIAAKSIMTITLLSMINHFSFLPRINIEIPMKISIGHITKPIITLNVLANFPVIND